MRLVRSSQDESFPLDERALVVGSGPDCDVRLGEAEASHARISRAEIEAIARCTVGGVALEAGERRLLVPGCEIAFGAARLVIDADDAMPSVPTRELGLRMLARADEPLHVMVPTLLVVQGPQRSARLPLAERRTYIVGRDATCDFRLERDAGVSRLHVSVALEDGVIVARDLGSRQGTFLGEARLEPSRAAVWEPSKMLRVGDGIVLGLLLPPLLRAETVDYVERRRGVGARSEPEQDPVATSPLRSAAPVSSSPASAPERGPTAAAPIADVGGVTGDLTPPPAIAVPATPWRPRRSEWLVAALAAGLVLLAIAFLVWILL